MLFITKFSLDDLEILMWFYLCAFGSGYLVRFMIELEHYAFLLVGLATV